MEVNDGWVLGVCDPVNCDHPFKNYLRVPNRTQQYIFPSLTDALLWK